MTRRELAEALADKLGIPVAPTPLDPVTVPGLVCGPGAAYRSSLVACAWSHGVEVLVVAGTMGDDGNVYDLCDGLVDDVLDALDAFGVAVAAVATPGTQPIGNVDHLTVAIQATLP